MDGRMLDALARIESISLTWNSGLNSQFDRETFQPGFGYQLGVGGLEAFRAIDGDSAVSATDRSDFRASSIFGLLLGSQLAVNYTNSTNDGYDLRGGARTQRNTTWPSVRLAWRQIPLPAAVSPVLLAASFVTGFERVERVSTYGIVSAQRRGNRDRRFPIEVSLTFAGGIQATWTGPISRGTTTDPTGDGEQDATNHTLQISGSIQPPAFLNQKVKSPVQAMLVLSQDDQRRCRFTTFTTQTSQCIAFIDATTRSLTFTLDTALSDLTVGLRAIYTDRQTHVGTQTGSSQFQLALFGRFNFVQGVMPGR
jgi:hypothetical protein